MRTFPVSVTTSFSLLIPVFGAPTAEAKQPTPVSYCQEAKRFNDYVPCASRDTWDAMLTRQHVSLPPRIVVPNESQVDDFDFDFDAIDAVLGTVEEASARRLQAVLSSTAWDEIEA